MAIPKAGEKLQPMHDLFDILSLNAPAVVVDPPSDVKSTEEESKDLPS